MTRWVASEAIAKAKHLVIASGGSAARADAILAAIRNVGCNTLVTDEEAARHMLTQLEG